MLEKTYNAVVHHTVATTAEETAAVFAQLSAAVVSGLAAELEVAGDVHRYDLPGKRAYYFVKKDGELAVWRWNDVYRPHEAGELIFQVVSADEPLDERLASECYTRATGRAVPGAGPAPTGD